MKNCQNSIYFHNEIDLYGIRLQIQFYAYYDYIHEPLRARQFWATKPFDRLILKLRPLLKNIFEFFIDRSCKLEDTHTVISLFLMSYDKNLRKSCTGGQKLASKHVLFFHDGLFPNLTV